MLKKLFTKLTSLFRQSESGHKAKRTSKKRKPQREFLSPETDAEDSILCYIRYQIDGQDDLEIVHVSREPTSIEALALARRHNRRVFGNLRTGEVVVTDIFCASKDDFELI